MWRSLALVVFQLSVAIPSTKFLPIWASAILSYTIGAAVDHALSVLIHDATHNLVFKRVWSNRLVLLPCNIPHVFPSAMMFRIIAWEARLIGNSPFRKSIWLAFFFIVQALRTIFYTYRIPKDVEVLWMALNWAINIAATAAVIVFAGWKPLAFASISSIGLHPLGARWIQELYPTQPFQATYSYYAIANRFAFAIGYHVEHHDFPSVPWNKLPTLKAMAPEYYDTLFACYSELLKDFIFEGKWSLSL